MDSVVLFQEILKCKWTLKLLDALAKGPRRPAELGRELEGLSKKVLHDRLNNLEKNGIVSRKVVSERPSHVEYRLTLRGQSICGLIGQVKALR